MRKLISFALAAGIVASFHAAAQRPADAAASGALPTLAAKTAGMKHMPGFLALDWDARAGKMYLEVPLGADGRSEEILYTDSLPWGTGSNDLGLDRGQTGRGRVVRFERTGPKVLLVEPNEMFRSSATDPAEQLALTQSFPTSVIFGFTVAAEGDGVVLIDATDLFLRDVHNVAESLARTQQGAYKVDLSRSTIALDATKAFPENTEVEAELTFTTDAAPRGEFVRDVTPDPHAMTVRERQSFVMLPKLGAANDHGTFTPRRFNPRAGYFPSVYRDYSVPLGDSMDQLFIIHHRLSKKDPNCVKACEAVAPIQYYVDRGAAEPMRSALLEGARWWDAAFQAAGWAPGTFKVDFLPEGADPMDVRYNIIQWVHRYTRGWSYGAAVTDPRTGEILKGNVTLGSLRGRQDYLIAESLLSPYKDGKTPTPDPMLALVLQRLRQLAAHETGHTLGLAHNFAASTYSPNDHEHTLSVMEYPHPYVTLGADGKIDTSHAYPVGIGIWDKTSIDYGYREFDKGGKPVEDAAALAKILTDSDKTGMVFLTDEDARPLGSASPIDHLWDNGTWPTPELERVLTVRAAALKNFGIDAIKNGTPLAQMEATLVPLYLFHRYQAEATVKVLGGLDYRYNLRGDGQSLPEIVPAEKQRAALTALLKTISPETLTLPESLLKILPPVPPGYPRTQESFPAHTGLTFDPIAAAESAADLTLAGLFNPQRAARLVEYHARDASEPSLGEVITTTLKAVADRPAGETLATEVSRAVEARTIEWLLALAANPAASAETRAIVAEKLAAYKSSGTISTTPEELAHHAALAARIDEFTRDPAKFVPAKAMEAPPGMPIGDDEDEF
jgi:hypothetical protein